MKVGDFYYCIRSRYSGKNGSMLVHKSDEKYEIKQIRESVNRITLKTECRYDDYFFYTIKKDDMYWSFNDYFVSLSDYRKMKLKKLNEL